MNAPQNSNPRVLWVLPAVLTVVVGAAVAALIIPLLNGPPAPPGAGPGPVADAPVEKLTRQASLELLTLRDRAVAALENLNFEQAERDLQEIIRQVPTDPFGPRNLTICRELALDKVEPGRPAGASPDGLRLAREAADQLSKVESDSHVPRILSARIAVRQGNLDLAAAELRRAVEIAPDAAAAWYDLYALTPVSPGEPPPKQTVDALRRVHELEPDNLFVLKDWLPLQAQMKDPGLADSIEQARRTLDPFADVIKTNIRVDVRQLLDRLAAAVAAQQWPAAASSSLTIRNVIVAEAARDERYVRLNSLEYLLFDFGPAFYQRADLPEPADEGVPVKFVRQSGGVPGRAHDVVAADFNLDGRLEIAVLSGDQVIVSNPAEPGAMNVTVLVGEGFRRLMATDLDDDVVPALKERTKDAINCPAADPDLIVYGAAGVKLFETFRQAESLEFREKPAGDVLSVVRDVVAVVPGDLDLDGDLDFVTLSSSGVQVWSNRGNWSFDEITGRSKLPPVSFGPTAAVLVDWDRDTDVDLLVAGAEGAGVLESLRHGRFRWRAFDGDLARLKGATSLLVEQLGGRPSWSVIGAGPQGIDVVRTETTVAGVVSPARRLHVADGPVDRVVSLDFDNDGIRDLAAAGAGRGTVYRGMPDGTFEAVTAEAIAKFTDCRAVAAGDLDRDGDEDLLIASADPAQAWIENDGGNANGWLNVALVAMQIKANEQNYSKRVNHSGIGSMVEVKSGIRYQSQVVAGQGVHFGLGPHKNADALRILWTNGIPQNNLSPAANSWICEEQKLHGSCPYLYTWDGEKFVFCTDLLWNAPLGLKFAEDVVAPWREWEYLKIDADKLRPRDGQYQLRVTAELWEVEYFDEIRVFAVDHPAGTQIFTNEKVGPASLAEHKIHTVAAPRVPVAARDTQGRDVLDQVKARDGNFTRTFDRKIAQGLTTEHFLELDLGDWSSAGRPAVTLFLTGWMYPGSTSLSVQHSQNPDQARPRPPSLQAIDSSGQWREVRPFMGFPGGKTKTIAVDLSDVFPPGSVDHRVRIVTNMEFYWDAAFVTVNDQPVEFRQTELTLAGATLADRGGVALRRWPDNGNGPELFDYHQLVPGDMWPPIDGKFTRLGDVRPLLLSRDDQLVVMHPGDEIQLAFDEPAEPLPAGWVRDFVIYNVGWDKDCDQNTVYGETSEPLPFQAMTDYAHHDGHPRPLDPEYVRYLQTYQTRTRGRAPFWNAIERGGF